MFPGGNAGVARHILKQLLPNAISGGASMAEICRGRVQFAALDRSGQPVRFRSNSTVVSVKHEGQPGAARTVEILYTRDGKFEQRPWLWPAAAGPPNTSFAICLRLIEKRMHSSIGHLV